MIEFDVDMGYLLEEGELDGVVLNDENGEHEPMMFLPDRGKCEMVTSGTPCTGNTDKRCTSCGAFNIGEFYDGQDHIVTTPRFCPNCGKAVKR